LNFMNLSLPKKGWIELNVMKSQPLYTDEKIIKYKQNILCHDVGAYIFLVHIKSMYPWVHTGTTSTTVPMTLEEIKYLDYEMCKCTSPQHLIYYDKNGKLYYDPSIFGSGEGLSVYIVSHEKIYDEGHFGAFIVMDKEAIYYDCNNVEDRWYYDTLEDRFKELCEEKGWKYKYHLVYSGLQNVQRVEAERYNFELDGLCSSWTYYIVEQMIKKHTLDVNRIESSIRKRYRYYLTRMIATYSFKLHQKLWDMIEK